MVELERWFQPPYEENANVSPKPRRSSVMKQRRLHVLLARARRIALPCELSLFTAIGDNEGVRTTSIPINSVAGSQRDILF